MAEKNEWQVKYEGALEEIVQLRKQLDESQPGVKETVKDKILAEERLRAGLSFSESVFSFCLADLTVCMHLANAFSQHFLPTGRWTRILERAASISRTTLQKRRPGTLPSRWTS